jgi:hypothetical protein
MVMDRELASDELIEESERSRAQLAAVTDRLSWLVAELAREFDLDDEDQEPDAY